MRKLLGLRGYVSCCSCRVRRLGPRPRPLGLLLPPLVDGVCIYLLVHRPGSFEGDSRSAGSGNRSRPIGTRDDSPIPAGSGFRDATGVFKFANLNRPPECHLRCGCELGIRGGTGVHRDGSFSYACHHPLPRHGHSRWVFAARRPASQPEWPVPGRHRGPTRGSGGGSWGLQSPVHSPHWH